MNDEVIKITAYVPCQIKGGEYQILTPLFLEVVNDGFIIAAAPGKGEVLEQEALDLISKIERIAQNKGLNFEVFKRYPSAASKVDAIKFKSKKKK